MEPNGPQPFRLFEKVIAVDALPKSVIKNGKIYTILSVEQDRGQDGNLYWYVGVEGTHNRIRPTIFAPLNPPKMMTFERMTENIHAN